MSESSLEDEKMLDIYIYDYFKKRKLHASAKSFQTEGKVFTNPAAIDVPGGFLSEWWSVFWDIFITRTNKHHSEAAASYIELQQQQYLQKAQQKQWMQMQQLVPQRQTQQLQEHQQQGLQQLKKRRAGSNLVNDATNRLVVNSSLIRKNPATANEMVGEMCEDRFKLPYQRNVLTDVLSKRRLVRNVSQLQDPDHASVFGTAPVCEPTSQILHGLLGDGSESISTQHQSQQLPASQGLDQLWSDLLQPRWLTQLPQAFNQFQQLDQLRLQGAKNLRTPSANMACIRSGVPFNNQSMNIGKDKQLHFTDMSNVESMVPVCSPVLSHMDADMLTKSSKIFSKKLQLKIDDQKQQQFLQHLDSSQHSQNSNHQMQQQDKSTSAGIVNADSYMSNNFETDDQANVDHLMDDGTLDDMESFPYPDESDLTDKVGLSSNANKSCTFKEIRLIPASTNKVECCRFSSDGKLLASGGHDKKATVWCTESFVVKSTLDEHSQRITDVCFSPRTLKIATSSDDRTVKVWDVGKPGHSLRTFMGHSTGVTSLDFHPSKDDLICSCDIDSEIRYWSIKNGSCVGIFKGGASQLRFRPNNGRILAAAVRNYVSIIDVETQVCRLKLQGHKNQVYSVCWDPSGEVLASVSDDLAKVWKVSSGSKGDCIHEMNCNGNKFHTCAFHPTYPFLLIIGSDESLELWDMTKNKTRRIHAHDKLISSLAVSNITGLVASSSHDQCVKLWQ